MRRILRSAQRLASVSNRGSMLALAVITTSALLQSGCDLFTGESMVSGTARILNGATGPASLLKTLPSRLPASKSTVPEDGIWILSPDQVRITLRNIGFGSNSGGTMAELGECTVTYDRTAPSLSLRLDCPFEVAVGTYTTVVIEYEITHQVLIDDPVNGFYTDPNSPSGL